MMQAAPKDGPEGGRRMTALATELATYNFAYLDEQTKRMIRRAI